MRSSRAWGIAEFVTAGILVLATILCLFVGLTDWLYGLGTWMTDLAPIFVWPITVLFSIILGVSLVSPRRELSTAEAVLVALHLATHLAIVLLVLADVGRWARYDGEYPLSGRFGPWFGWFLLLAAFGFAIGIAATSKVRTGAYRALSSAPSERAAHRA